MSRLACRPQNRTNHFQISFQNLLAEEDKQKIQP